MIHYENYWIYADVVSQGFKEIKTSEITRDNWQQHYDSIFNIMLDTIELEETKHMFIRIIFDETPDKDSIELSLYDYSLNLIFWWLQVSVNKPILPQHLFFKKYIPQKELKNYIDKYFIPQNRKTISIIEMNNIIDTSMYNFVRIDAFSMFLANTMNMSDFLYLMDRNKDIYDIIHSDFTDVPLADIKKRGMEAMNRFVEIVKEDSRHCLSYFVRAGEGLNKKQAKEVLVNIGTKPDGLGGIFPHQVNTNYFLGGVNSIIPFFIDASTARFAQIIINKNVGNSGHFSRLIGLNNLNTKLHEDKNYVCDTHPSNFEKLYIENLDMVNALSGQYYRLSPNGMEYNIEPDDSSLVGKTIYKRSPMTCASAARGEGICYRCYGDLAYSVNNINVGKIAAEVLSSIIIQRMLSSKHLIDAELIEMEWSDMFEDIFEIDFNILKLQSDKDYTGYKLSIDMNNILSESDDEDDMKYNDGIFMNNYLNEFNIIDPNGEVFTISTKEYDNIYITPELWIYLNSKIGKNKTIDDIFTSNLNDFMDMSLFSIKLENNDLTKALDKVKNILDKNQVISRYDRNSILQDFLITIQECNLNVHSSHCEVLLMNQIRANDDIISKPKWEYANEENYKLLPLKKSLQLNPSVTISLMFQGIKKILIDPETYRKEDAGITDLFFMRDVTPYLSDKYVEKPVYSKQKKMVYYPESDQSELE